MRVTPLALTAALLGGCPAPPAGDAGRPPVDLGPDAPCAPNGAAVTMGGGTGPTTAGFRALADGDGVYLTPGPQGGQHIWIGLRGSGFDPTQPLVHLKAFRASDGELIGQLRIRLRFALLPEDPTQLALAAQTLVIDDDRYCSVLGGDVLVTLDFNDGAGRCAHVERRVRVEGIDPTALEIDRTARTNCCTQYLRRCYPLGPPADASVDAGLDASVDAGLAAAFDATAPDVSDDGG